MVDVAADQLARIDDRSYRRDQTKDAESVLSELVLPMSFPWTHRVIPHQVTSRDIDDLEGIVTCQEEVPGQDRLGALLETTTWTLPQHQTVAARRSSQDPGIINFFRFRTPQFMDLSTEQSSVGLPGAKSDEEGIYGDSGFLDEINHRKRRRIDIMESNAERFTVSIRFGGSSSRSSLRPTDASLGEPLMLLAKLPNEVAGGRKLDASLAAKEAYSLGSYDHRHGLPRLDCTKRVRAGRTRTIWSSKLIASQRPGHRSLLTGCVLENGQHRRPSDVKVFLRFNGCLVTLEKGQMKRAGQEEDNEWAGSGYGDHIVDKALATAEEHEMPDTSRENLQCSLAIDKYLESFEKQTSTSLQFVRRLNEPYSVRVVKKDSMWVNIRPPRLWSHPCEDGVFEVICSEPGELKGIQYTQDPGRGVPSKNYPWATAILLDSVAKQHQACCICWSDSGDESDKDLMICSQCQVQVHPKCYLGRSVLDAGWCCDSCVDYQQRAHLLPASLTPLNVRWARKCGLCDQFGSAVVLHKPIGWVHVYCRVWLQAEAFEHGVCIICSKTSQHLVRCGATACSLKFHPMCAVVASHAAAAGRASDPPHIARPIEYEEDRDIFLCTQYCQETVRLSFGTKNMKRSIPVAYCGLHNPGRAADRFGLLPGALHVKDAVRLPLQRKYEIA
eukprot:scaffold437_cov159-Amphora_coffeaeformis.AAC.4